MPTAVARATIASPKNKAPGAGVQGLLICLQLELIFRLQPISLIEPDAEAWEKEQLMDIRLAEDLKPRRQQKRRSH